MCGAPPLCSPLSPPPTPTPPLSGALATGGVLATGLIAFRKVRKREREREREIRGGGVRDGALTPSPPPLLLRPSPFLQGNQKLSQSMMRWRVAAQGATVAVMVASAGAGVLGWGGEQKAR